MKTCAFCTLGCKVNQYETQSIRESFIKAGYEEVDFRVPSDVYVINTCTVTAKTDSESRRLIREAKRRNPHARIVITGCYAELNADEINEVAERLIVVKNRDKDKIIDIINPREAFHLGYSDNEEYLPLIISDFKDRTKAFLKVQDGCNNFCSYCKVPLARGHSRSRDIKSTIKEASRLIARGFKEIVVTGICLGAWGEDLSPKSCLDKLLGELIKLEGSFRIRLSSIEPKYVNPALISTMKSSPKLCKHLHIPFQSGDDEILKMMSRPYTAAKYIEITEMVRREIPEISITTDIMVGFPGETETNFDNTYRFIEKIEPSRIHIFSYSKRGGTKAALLKHEVPKNVAKGRLARIKDLALNTSYNYRKNYLQRETEVLVETTRDNDTGLLKGYDDKYIKVLLKGGDVYKARIVPVTIEKIEVECTLGTILQN